MLIYKRFWLLALTLGWLNSYAQIVTDGTVGPVNTLIGTDITISDQLGQQIEGNLFHSFQDFNINSGESATFTGPHSVANILARVTGGNRSVIDGTLRSEIPNANLYLLNPSGILFGEKARLDITGSFHTSTADEIRLGDKGLFSATHPNHSLLVSAPPQAYGFLDNRPASITIQGSFIQTREGQTLSFIGGDLQFEDSSLYAPAGQINLAAVASEGQVIPSSSHLQMASFNKLGKITLSQSSDERIHNTINGINTNIANIDVSSIEGGQVFIRAGQFISNKGWLFADTFGGKTASNIDIAIDGEMQLTNKAKLTSDNLGEGQGGHLKVTTNQVLQLSGQSIISTNNFSIGTGGEIQINTPRLEMNLSAIQSATAGSGNAGNIVITTQKTLLNNRGLINASTASAGQAGYINITATDEISISNTSSISGSTATDSSGQGGNIQLNTQHLNLEKKGQIHNASFGSGNAGSITLTANHASLSEGTIATLATQAGGGNIDLQVRDSLHITDNSWITAEAKGIKPEHKGGNLTIRNPNFFTQNHSELHANAYAGNGGDIRIITDYFIPSSDSVIDASSQLGIDGQVQINARNMDFIDIQLPSPPPSPQLLLNPCTSFPQETLSTFSLTNRIGLLTTPEDLMK